MVAISVCEWRSRLSSIRYRRERTWKASCFGVRHSHALLQRGLISRIQHCLTGFSQINDTTVILCIVLELFPWVTPYLPQATRVFVRKRAQVRARWRTRGAPEGMDMLWPSAFHEKRVV